MKKFRFKTQQEFIDCGRWDSLNSTPYGWNPDGEMNEYLGREISEFYLEECEAGESFRLDGWTFCSYDYVEVYCSDRFTQIEEAVMEVSKSGKEWVTRVVFGKKNGSFLAWISAETLEEAENVTISDVWNYARPVKIKLTLKQVADKFGLKEEEIEIVR